jgi:hypothetical protein
VINPPHSFHIRQFSQIFFLTFLLSRVRILSAAIDMAVKYSKETGENGITKAQKILYFQTIR